MKTALCVFAFLAVFAVLLHIYPRVLPPKFSVINQSHEPVNMTVEWREKSRDLETVVPGESIDFRINDEAAATFTADYPDGEKFISSPIYFTSGIGIHARVTKRGIEVGYDPDP